MTKNKTNKQKNREEFIWRKWRKRKNEEESEGKNKKGKREEKSGIITKNSRGRERFSLVATGHNLHIPLTLFSISDDEVCSTAAAVIANLQVKHF